MSFWFYLVHAALLVGADFVGAVVSLCPHCSSSWGSEWPQPCMLG